MMFLHVTVVQRRYGLTVSSTSKNAQPPAGAKKGRGDSSQDQSHVTRPAKQAEGKEPCSVLFMQIYASVYFC